MQYFPLPNLASHVFWIYPSQKFSALQSEFDPQEAPTAPFSGTATGTEKGVGVGAATGHDMGRRVGAATGVGIGALVGGATGTGTVRVTVGRKIGVCMGARVGGDSQVAPLHVVDRKMFKYKSP